MERGREVIMTGVNPGDKQSMIVKSKVYGGLSSQKGKIESRGQTKGSFGTSR